jgi:hypothetical protein
MARLLPVQEKSQDFTIKMQGNLYKMDLYIWPLASCDIILGIKRLRLLANFVGF